jgi:hypothetical protein
MDHTYTIELSIKNTTYAARSASYLDINLKIGLLAATLFHEILIKTTSSGMSDQLRDIYSICRYCWNVVTYQ